MRTADELEEQRAIVGNLRSDCGVLMTALDGLIASRAAYDRLGLYDDSVLEDAALMPLGTTRPALHAAIEALDSLIAFVAQGYSDRLETFARGR